MHLITQSFGLADRMKIQFNLFFSYFTLYSSKHFTQKNTLQSPGGVEFQVPSCFKKFWQS